MSSPSKEKKKRPEELNSTHIATEVIQKLERKPLEIIQALEQKSILTWSMQDKKRLSRSYGCSQSNESSGRSIRDR